MSTSSDRQINRCPSHLAITTTALHAVCKWFSGKILTDIILVAHSIHSLLLQTGHIYLRLKIFKLDL